ncbi:MAG: PQQ-dependent sugar dehydrogenase [Phycisphaera sp.]|nr:MAG: PQQ-dependent sugar dehydrogenase [Phycisphaera sp.]
MQSTTAKMLRAPVLLAAAGLIASTSQAQVDVRTEVFLTGLDQPTALVHAPGDHGRVFVTEKRGRIRVVRDGQLLPTPFLDIDGLISSFGERGLLGIAMSPEFDSDGWVFVHYSNNAGDTVIARYTVSDTNPDMADPDSGVIILTQDQPFSNHNGGWIDFGPNDDHLYIALGDGGSGGDPQGNGQRLTTLLGKTLRIDVLGPPDPGMQYAIPADNPFVGTGNREEIWAYGLRNHYRNDFDPANGDMYIADVGQGAREEVNYQPGDSAGGENYGWKCREGDLCFSTSLPCPSSCDPSPFVEPVMIYDHSVLGGCSITGGQVYRGCQIDELAGTYFYADYCSNRVWSIRMVDGDVTEFTERTSQFGGLSSIISFGRDAYGELYVLSQGGTIRKVMPVDPIDDCDGDLVSDACEIAVGAEADVNGDGIPDSCQCLADLDGDGELTLFDFLEFQNLFDAGDPAADFDGDGSLTLFDFLAFQNAFVAGCP